MGFIGRHDNSGNRIGLGLRHVGRYLVWER
jgi:hypothetical protein